MKTITFCCPVCIEDVTLEYKGEVPVTCSKQCAYEQQARVAKRRRKKRCA